MLEWLKLSRLTIVNTGKDMKELELSDTHGGNVKQLNDFGKQFWWILKKLSIHLPYDPAIPLLGVCPREKNAYFHSKTYR